MESGRPGATKPHSEKRELGIAPCGCSWVAVRPARGLRSTNPDGGISRRGSGNGAPKDMYLTSRCWPSAKYSRERPEHFASHCSGHFQVISLHIRATTPLRRVSLLHQMRPEAANRNSSLVSIFKGLGQSRVSITFASICPLSPHRFFMGPTGFRPGSVTRMRARGN